MKKYRLLSLLGMAWMVTASVFAQNYPYQDPTLTPEQRAADLCSRLTLGAEVVQLYMRRPADVDGPNKSLRGYERVDLAPGETRTVAFDMPRALFENWDPDLGRMRVVPGAYELQVGSSSLDRDLQTLTVSID